MNILMTSGGRRVAMLRAFRNALRVLKLEGKIIVTDMTETSAAFQDADKGVTVPRCTSPEYINTLLDICLAHKIELLVPFIDTELDVLAANRERFEQIGVTTVVSGPVTMSVANDKRATAEFFQSIGLATPALLNYTDALKGTYNFPLFIKPVAGSCSIGSRIINDLAELEFWWPRTTDPILLEYISGVEYTVDVYTGLDGTVHCAVPRRRVRVRAGEVEKGITEAQNEVIAQSMTAARALKDVRGVITMQCIVRDDGTPHFIEINARLGGGAPLSVESGADFPRWMIEEAQGNQPEIGSPAFEPNVIMLRFDDAVFVRNGHELT